VLKDSGVAPSHFGQMLPRMEGQSAFLFLNVMRTSCGLSPAVTDSMSFQTFVAVGAYAGSTPLSDEVVDAHRRTVRPDGVGVDLDLDDLRVLGLQLDGGREVGVRLPGAVFLDVDERRRVEVAEELVVDGAAVEVVQVPVRGDRVDREVERAALRDLVGVRSLPTGTGQLDRLRGGAASA
jgi:hypothetical protein